MFLKFCNVIKTNFAYKLQPMLQLKILAKNFTYIKRNREGIYLPCLGCGLHKLPQHNHWWYYNISGSIVNIQSTTNTCLQIETGKTNAPPAIYQNVATPNRNIIPLFYLIYYGYTCRTAPVNSMGQSCRLSTQAQCGQYVNRPHPAYTYRTSDRCNYHGL